MAKYLIHNCDNKKEATEYERLNYFLIKPIIAGGNINEQERQKIENDVSSIMISTKLFNYHYFTLSRTHAR